MTQQPIRVLGPSALTGRYYAVTRYVDHRNGRIEAIAKQDVTPDVQAIADAAVAQFKARLVHEPHDDDGATYCGWSGDGGITGGCGEPWPCSTIRASKPQANP